MNTKKRYNDFPPTEEDDKTRSWFLPYLNMSPEELELVKNKKQSVIINVDEEEAYESRVYSSMPYVFPKSTFKFFAKRKKGSDTLEVYVKLDDRLTLPKTMTIVQYREEVKRFETEILKTVFDVNRALVCDFAYYQKQHQETIERMKKIESEQQAAKE
jgi:hypothetical protein